MLAGPAGTGRRTAATVLLERLGGLHLVEIEVDEEASLARHPIAAKEGYLLDLTAADGLGWGESGLRLEWLVFLFVLRGVLLPAVLLCCPGRFCVEPLGDGLRGPFRAGKSLPSPLQA